MQSHFSMFEHGHNSMRRYGRCIARGHLTRVSNETEQRTECFQRCTKLHSTSKAGGPSSLQCWSCHGSRGPAAGDMQ
jgi:hypothetical protein